MGQLVIGREGSGAVQAGRGRGSSCPTLAGCRAGVGPGRTLRAKDWCGWRCAGQDEGGKDDCGSGPKPQLQAAHPAGDRSEGEGRRPARSKLVGGVCSPEGWLGLRLTLGGPHLLPSPSPRWSLGEVTALSQRQQRREVSHWPAPGRGLLWPPGPSTSQSPLEPASCCPPSEPCVPKVCWLLPTLALPKELTSPRLEPRGACSVVRDAPSWRQLLGARRLGPGSGPSPHRAAGSPSQASCSPTFSLLGFVLLKK